jgi:hypothetical protein
MAGRKIAGLPSDVRDIAVLPNAPKRAAATGTAVKAGADMTAGYLPKDMPASMAAPKPMMQTGAAPSMKGGMDGKGAERMSYGGKRDVSAERKSKRALQCDRDGNVKQY